MRTLVARASRRLSSLLRKEVGAALLMAVVLAASSLAAPGAAAAATWPVAAASPPAAAAGGVEGAAAEESAAPAPVLRAPSGELQPVGLPVPYGYQVAISGDTAAVAGFFRDVPAVWVFVRTAGAWAVQARLVSPLGSLPQSFFGSVMALSGDTLAVGAGSDATNASAVYVYTRSGGTWKQAATLEPPAAAGPGFGLALALAGDTLVVGAPGDSGEADGTASIYTQSSGFALQAVLKPESTATDLFGQAVAVAHQAVMVGAPGLVEVFQRKGGAWSRVVVLEGGGTTNSFGAALAASNETLAVGDPANQRVSLYIHAGGSWVHQQDVVPGDPAAGEFGSALALSGGDLVVGAPATTVGDATKAGAVYTFARLRHSWTPTAAFTPAANLPGAGFGGVVAVSQNTAVVGYLSASPGTATAWLLNGLDVH
jgi:FG-GAP repeat